MNTYAGESPQKKIARSLLYFHVGAEGMLGEPRTTGDLLSLAGPEAREIPIMRAVLGSGATGVIVCDVDERGVSAAREQGASAFHGTINDALAHMGRLYRLSNEHRRTDRHLGFVHLDFMGNTNDTVASAARRAAPMLRDGSIVAWTFLRGREGSHNRRWREATAWLRQNRFLQELASAIDRDSGNRDGTRVVAYMEQLSEWLRHGSSKRSWWLPITVITYDSGRSPMGIVVMKRFQVGQLPLGFTWHDVAPRWGDDVRGFAEWMQSKSPSGTKSFSESIEFLSRCLWIEKSTLIAWRAVASAKRNIETVAAKAESDR